mmetsp:Transcript_51785/g.121597  ORF Transcript_51785/g.121597 Transcript_51785/m.121597 type:complete len:263 (+) Transcript_51785:43-831(+)
MEKSTEGEGVMKETQHAAASNGNDQGKLPKAEGKPPAFVCADCRFPICEESELIEEPTECWKEQVHAPTPLSAFSRLHALRTRNECLMPGPDSRRSTDIGWSYWTETTWQSTAQRIPVRTDSTSFEFSPTPLEYTLTSATNPLQSTAGFRASGGGWLTVLAAPPTLDGRSQPHQKHQKQRLRKKVVRTLRLRRRGNEKKRNPEPCSSMASSSLACGKTATFRARTWTMPDRSRYSRSPAAEGLCCYDAYDSGEEAAATRQRS